MAGKVSDHVSTSQGYPRGGRSKMDRDPEGQLRDQLATVPCHIAGIVMQEDKIVFNSLIDWQGLHPHIIGL